jgi:PAS domain S-box-containing protein
MYATSVPDRERRDASSHLSVLDAISGYAMVGLDLTARIVSWSAGAERLTGYTENEARGQPYVMVGAGHWAAELPRMLEKSRDTGCFQQERWWRRSDGGLIWVHETINPVHGKGYVVIARDLTESAAAEDRRAARPASLRERSRQSREQELRSRLYAAERRAAFLSEASSILVAAAGIDFQSALSALARLAVSQLSDMCVIHVLDSDGTLARAELTHRDPAMEQRLGKALHVTLSGGWERAVRTAIGSGRTEIMERARLGDLTANFVGGVDAVADDLVGSIMVTPLMGRGHVLGAISFVAARDREFDEYDVSLAEDLGSRAAIALDNARLFREAQAASRAKANFLAVISHELRTPLNAIMGYSDLLSAGISGALTLVQQHQIDRIRASATHLLQLIEEILSYARIETGEADVRPEVVDAAGLARAAAAIIEPMTHSKGLDLRIDADSPITFETDSGKVRQVLVNLLSNAAKFTERGSVVVNVRMSGAEVVYDVIDTGIGMAEDELTRIFDPFWQAERPSTRRAGGTGLGLSVARRYVSLLSGHLAVESRVGQGTRVSVHLPARLTPGTA